ncbi:sensor histidine kinase [Mesobacillus boroniphilus]|uniref:histidine kinase n=1 Tax=Mesobacillus boroniphilus TaxID=308892 RepID=A0A944GWZ1_9BACI|nr:HAMP domain-containing sensor histidine kinase [Mesobacillus boroniphilus]MBS8264160.1 sensor histidine kinase [Mesobacillus boroniphilus]
MKALKYSNPSHFSFEMKERRANASGLILDGPLKEYPGYFPTFLPLEKSFPNHNLAMTKDELTMVDLYLKKEDLESKSLKLEQEIAEKQQTLKRLQQAIESATGDIQAASASHLAAGLAHEIRNPLTTIKGFIQLLKPELQAAGRQEFADVALDEISRANSLLTEFLSVLKPASSEKKKKLSINPLAMSMIKLFLSESIMKDIEISDDLPKVEIYVFADENAIKQVLVNLFKNAIEAVEGNHRKKGSIKLVVNKDGGFVCVSVIDNGGGIDEYSLKKIFTPFYTTKANGTGMGLAISKQIIENHGGEMSVTTQPYETTFKFSLPAI